MCSTSCEKMKITAGIGSLDDYISFAEAGADEVFCGYVPAEWMEKAGMANPINRREVIYPNVQMGSWSEMEILAKMQEDIGVPVTVTLNSPFYDPRYYGDIIKVIRDCREIGIGSFIVADPGLIAGIAREEIPGIHLHVSGEAGEANRYAAEMARKHGAERIIFGRKTTIADMRAMISQDRNLHPHKPMEAEAFAMNEMCHFSGGFCCTYHCDELAPMCRVPYKLGSVGPESQYKQGEQKSTEPEDDWDDAYRPGWSGCGLCALWDLRDAGVTHLKVVSRGNYSEDTIRDIKALSHARECLAQESREAFIRKMKADVFENKCSGNCYYSECRDCKSL